MEIMILAFGRQVFLLLFLIRGAILLQVQITSNISAAVGDGNVKIVCHYTIDEGDNVLTIGLKRRNKINDTYNQIVSYYPNRDDAVITSLGNYLKDRVTLTNPKESKTEAILSFNDIRCEDDSFYRCEVTYTNDIVSQSSQTKPSNLCKITITNHPTNPEKIESSVVLSDVVEGQDVLFICKGNIGNPPGKFEWKKISYDNKMTTYSVFNSTKEYEPENCTWYGTSNLTIQLTAEDNKARVQCEIQSQTDAVSTIVTTQEINVFYPVRDVIITTKPSMDTYPPGSSVKLTCEANGNPAPFLYWYRDSDMNNNNVDAGSNLNVNESGTYACFAKNIVNGTAYNLTQTKAITIDNGTSGDTTAPDSKLIVIAVAAPIGLAAVIITLCCCCCKRKQVSPPKDIDQMHLSDSNSESAVQISQVYSEVKDSFKRCPKTSSEVPVGVSEYAEVDPTTKTIFYKAEKPFKVDDDNIAHEYATVVKHHKIT